MIYLLIYFTIGFYVGHRALNRIENVLEKEKVQMTKKELETLDVLTNFAEEMHEKGLSISDNTLKIMLVVFATLFWLPVKTKKYAKKLLKRS